MMRPSARKFIAVTSAGKWPVLRAAAAACVALTLSVLSGSGSPRATAATFGDDDRKPLSQSRARLAASIGLVASGDGRHACTAVCLSDSVIASAAHCLLPALRDPGAGTAPVALTFRIGPPQSTRSTALAIDDAATDTGAGGILLGARMLRLKAPINASEDWAIARLADPLCQSHGLPISTLSHAQILDAALDGRVSLAAFHRDVALDRLSIETGCAIENTFPDRGADDRAIKRDFAERDGLLLHRCDTGLGSSGAPLIVDTVAGPEIVGLNIGTYHIARVALSDGAAATRLDSQPVANTAVSAHLLAAALARFPGAETLKPGPAIAGLQQHLAMLGLYGGAWDGRSSLALRLAIITYERMRDLPQTGLGTTALAQRLAADPAAATPPDTSAPQSIVPTGTTH